MGSKHINIHATVVGFGGGGIGDFSFCQDYGTACKIITAWHRGILSLYGSVN